jgi:hypothetical protein
MDMSLNFATVNWLTVLGATTVGFVLGGAWYSPPLFGRFLPKLINEAESRTGSPRNIAAIFVTAFVMLWVAASFLAGLLGPSASAQDGWNVGLAIGLFFVVPALTIAAMFGSRPVRMIFIAGGYFMVCFGVMGLMLGTWH